jgi:hypothetical protein
MKRLVLAFVLLLALSIPRVGAAATIAATPQTLNALLPKLAPGDVLQLAAGHYAHFSVSGIAGKSDAWIVIRGPATDPPAIVDADACCNTIEISDASFVAIENLTIDGKDNGASFGISATGAVHDVRIENDVFIHHAGDQQQDAISTKTPTWGWIIRHNRIDDVGTGIYLGNSDGSDPFVGGLIERNLIRGAIGYCMQIKFQSARPTIAGMPTNATTIVRDNVFLKDDRPSPDGDRPSVLVGGFPATGPGSTDRYEIYRNFFDHNPREALLQASGRVTIHDNVFVDAPTTAAIVLINHDLPLRQAWVYDNTIYGAKVGISFGSPAPQGDAVFGNLVFAPTALSGSIANAHDNLTATVAAAPTYVAAPSLVLGAMDFHPKQGACLGPALDTSGVAADADHAVDFDGNARGDFRYRGAYVGDGTNPGWKLSDDFKGAVPPAGADAGAPPDGGASSDDAGSSAGAPPDEGGCSVGGGAAPPSWLLAVALVLVRRRRARQ